MLEMILLPPVIYRGCILIGFSNKTDQRRSDEV